jgi:hypothetical protein
MKTRSALHGIWDAMLLADQDRRLWVALIDWRGHEESKKEESSG